jgi:hypothetical protein
MLMTSRVVGLFGLTTLSFLALAAVTIAYLAPDRADRR